MNCRDFEQLWNEKLDAERVAGIDTDLEAHATTCPACAALATRFRRLQTAIQALPAPPAASADFLARLHSLPTDSRPQVTGIASRPAWIALAAAAVLVVGLTLAIVRPWNGGRVAPADSAVAKAETSGRSIGAAFAEATSATLDLALETSAPAGRVGLEVLSSASLPAADSPLSLQVPAASSTEILEAVGDRVGKGVKPLSGSARQAFGFLIRATTGDGVDHPSASPPRGT